jgi:hypothetical protein
MSEVITDKRAAYQLNVEKFTPKGQSQRASTEMSAKPTRIGIMCTKAVDWAIGQLVAVQQSRSTRHYEAYSKGLRSCFCPCSFGSLWVFAAGIYFAECPSHASRSGSMAIQHSTKPNLKKGWLGDFSSKWPHEGLSRIKNKHGMRPRKRAIGRQSVAEPRVPPPGVGGSGIIGTAYDWRWTRNSHIRVAPQCSEPR